MLERFQRDLEPAERKRFAAERRDLERRLRRAKRFFAALGVLTIAIGTPLALHQMAQEAGLGYLAFATIAAFLVAYAWAYRSTVGELAPVAAPTHAQVLRCRVGRYIAVCEIEDEGLEVFLEVGPNETLYLGGQQYYDIPNFPSAEMDLIELRDAHEAVVDFHVVCRGGPLKPLRTISEKQKLDLFLSELYPPEDGHVLPCSLDELEAYLAGETAP